MKDVHTVCPADIVGLPIKVVWLTAFFLKKKAIFVWLFVLATGWPTWESGHEECLKYNIQDIYFEIYIVIYEYIYQY